MKHYIYTVNQEPDTTFYMCTFSPSFEYVVHWFNPSNGELHSMTCKGWDKFSAYNEGYIKYLRPELKKACAELRKIVNIMGEDPPPFKPVTEKPLNGGGLTNATIAAIRHIIGPG